MRLRRIATRVAPLRVVPSQPRYFTTEAVARQLLLRCSGCGELVDGSKEAVFKCPQSDVPSGSEVDHVLVPQPMAGGYDTSFNPFVRYRSRLYSHRVAMARGMDDPIYVAMVNEIDNALVEIDGTGFYETPLRW